MGSSLLRTLVASASVLAAVGCRSESAPRLTQGVSASSLQKQTSSRFDQIVAITQGLRLTHGNDVVQWRVGEPLALPADHHSSGQLILRSVEGDSATVDYQVRFDGRSFGHELTFDRGSFVLPIGVTGSAPDAGLERGAKAIEP